MAVLPGFIPELYFQLTKFVQYQNFQKHYWLFPKHTFKLNGFGFLEFARTTEDFKQIRISQKMLILHGFLVVYIIVISHMKQSSCSSITKKDKHSQAEFEREELLDSEEAFNPRQVTKLKKKKIFKVIHNVVFYYYDAEGNRKTLIYQKKSQKTGKDQKQMLKKVENQGANFSSKTCLALHSQIQQNNRRQQMNSFLFSAPNLTLPFQYIFPQNHQTVQ